MLETIKESLANWNAQKSERQKLQHAYLVLAAVIVLLAGLLSLLDNALADRMVFLAMIAIGAYIVNAITWSLLRTSLLDNISTKPKKKKASTSTDN
jgi:hypothetical protein